MRKNIKGGFYTKNQINIIDFKFLEDKKYFTDILCGGDVEKLEKNCKEFFDFRSPSIKRKEFNVKKRALLPPIFKCAKGMCQICKSSKGTEVDHIIPLASNQLNKKFRKMHPTIVSGMLKKVPSESYGSNNLMNLQLTCKSCNRKKWNNFEASLKILSD